MAAVAQAVTGPGTPDAATVTAKPDQRLVVALILAGPAVSFMLACIVGILAFIFWPDALAIANTDIMSTIVNALAFIAFGLVALLGVVVFRLASGGLKKFEAKAGPAGLSLDTSGT